MEPDPDTLLFPLSTVLFPGGRLPLRIFEPRYLDLVSECLREDREFGICYLKSGSEVGPAAEPHAVGTLARITDWHQYDDGLLGIIALGETRFRLGATATRENGLLTGSILRFEDQPARALPGEYEPLKKITGKLIERAGLLYDGLPTNYDDATWLSFRLAELLPLPLAHKQRLLELEDPIDRLREVTAVLGLLGKSGSRGPQS